MTSQERREHREALERQIRGRRCQTCHGIPSVAYINQDFVIRCPCYPAPPVLYRPETDQELYKRTGRFRDAVTQMTVERQRIKKERNDN